VASLRAAGESNGNRSWRAASALGGLAAGREPDAQRTGLVQALGSAASTIALTKIAARMVA
jgi:hypothetical protein